MNYILTIYESDKVRYLVVGEGFTSQLRNTLEEAKQGLASPILVDEHVTMKRGEIQQNAALTNVYNIFPDLYTALVDRYPLHRLKATL